MMSVMSLEVIIGSLTFTGSLMAAGKLQELLPQRPIAYRDRISSTFPCSPSPSAARFTWW